jgi:hypothetical protein
MITGKELNPTYSYFREYRHGATLSRHTDREACEISLTINLGGDPWAFWLEGKRGRSRVSLTAGDAVLYRGLECPHWRNRFRGGQAFQTFLHYVDRHGRFAEWKFDKRARLGLPASSRKV